MILFPVLPERFQSNVREKAVAIPASLALPDVYHHAGAVDIRHCNMSCFAHPESRRVCQHEYGLVFDVLGGAEQGLDFFFIQDDGKLRRLLWISVYSGQFRRAFRFISGTHSDLIRALSYRVERALG